ncbi:DUF2786 domain-containing protein [Nocardia beijingensis]|uniref:DUF2786 domain-containing protein n=1 Tax=Nocardia beijingensis TaxID=95162 RepID=UPI000835FDA9|nr:DUF2786 domain-containing protein [Nocardia beijingensis]
MATSQKMLGPIGALLRKAEGTYNQYDAEAYFTMPQRLATQHSIAGAGEGDAGDAADLDR